MFAASAGEFSRASQTLSKRSPIMCGQYQVRYNSANPIPTRTQVRTREPQGRGANPVREPAASKRSRCRRPHTLRAGKNLRCAGIGGFVARVRASNARCRRDKRSNSRMRGIVASMPAPLAIMPTNIAKTSEYVSLEVRRTGVAARLMSAGESRPCVVECACLSPLRAREEGRFMTPVSSASTCAPCRRRASDG